LTGWVHKGKTQFETGAGIFMKIDSHQHFWHYQPQRDSWITDEMSVLKQDYLPAQLRRHLYDHEFEGSVAVQADQSEDETMFLLSLAEANSYVKGVVGWTELRSPALKDRLSYFKSFPKMKGFRHVVQSESKGFLGDTSFRNGVKLLAEFNYTYDLLIYHHQLEEALDFVRQLPEVKIVVDHIAKPNIKEGEKTHWELKMAAMATFSNVFCKLSGMVTEASWTNWKKNDFFPYLDEMMETFGPNRLMYGSDWPVCLLAGNYDAQLDIVESYVSGLSADERKAIMGENAIKFYGL
jgi:L-fuconolactonase